MSLLRQRSALILLGVMLVVTALIRPHTVWLDTSIVIAIYSLLGLSVGISYGQAGILSVAQAAFASIGAYATAIVTARYDMPAVAGLVLALALPALVAYPLARLVTRLSPLALAIATLVFGQAVDIGLREGGDFTGGYIGLSGIPPLSFASTLMQYHVLSWGLVLVVVVLISNLIDSPFGRAASTLRADTFRAVADGVDVPHIRSTVLALSASVAGLGGWLYAHHIAYIGPDSLGPSVSLSVLLMAVVGGAQTVLGPVVGAALLTLIFKFIPGQELQGMFYGGALIAVLVLTPNGLLGLRQLLRGHFASRRAPPTEPKAKLVDGVVTARSTP
jgi:ABC-type branched-subunit amino acid transport system permease subunit